MELFENKNLWKVFIRKIFWHVERKENIENVYNVALDERRDKILFRYSVIHLNFVPVLETQFLF